MAHRQARTPFLLAIAVLAFGVSLQAAPPDRSVFLAGKMADEERIAVTAALAASGHPGILLFDSPKSAPHVKAFLGRYQPEQVVPIGSSVDILSQLFPRPEQVVVSPAEPRQMLLQAACLAGVMRAPLLILKGPDEVGSLRRRLEAWQPRQVYAAGEAAKVCEDLPGLFVWKLPTTESVVVLYLRELAKQGPVRNLVVANPCDGRMGLENLSVLAPWIAAQHRAVLLLTNVAGDDVEALVDEAVRRPDLRGADTVLLVGGLQAIPMHRRPNPIPADRDPFIEMEPLTPSGREPFTFAVGRLFHEDPGVVALLLARQRLLAEAKGPRRALVASNPGGGLPLLETLSRNTAKELRNTGYQTTALFGDKVTRDDLRRRLPDYDVFLWEGHHNTLVRDWGFPEWDEPLPPSFIFLQSCLALTDWKAQPLLGRGAVAVAGSSTRVYSATGGAFALAYFDALLYDDQSLGGALRQAKNFLLAYSILKEKRLGEEAKRGGANLRSAWAFTLWGDPTLKLPRPEAPADALPAVRHEVHGNTITLKLPEARYDAVHTSKYQVQMVPNARLAGLLRHDELDAPSLALFLFAEVQLPEAAKGKTPRLSSKLPANSYVFCWDARRRCGCLLALPRSRDREELRFQVHWEATVAGK